MCVCRPCSRRQKHLMRSTNWIQLKQIAPLRTLKRKSNKPISFESMKKNGFALFLPPVSCDMVWFVVVFLFSFAHRRGGVMPDMDELFQAVVRKKAEYMPALHQHELLSSRYSVRSFLCFVFIFSVIPHSPSILMRIPYWCFFVPAVID